MTASQDRIALQERLREVLGEKPAATMMAMFAVNENVATKVDIDRLGGEMDGFRTELAMMRQEMDLKYATKDDLLEMRRDFDTNLKAFIRTFISVQAASMVGLTGIFYALVRLG